MSHPDQPKGELQFLRRLRQELQTPPDLASLVPFGDDMAALEAGDRPLLWTTDMLMDGVDFDSTRHAWYDIGRKAMAVNLSDCAAMAVVPVAALCAVALSDALSLGDALAILRGAQECGRQHGCPIVGGDTNSWRHPTVISITVAARPVPGLSPIRRDGARPGDRLFVSGPLGGSILGRHMTFEPRIALALEISRKLAPHALIDISDGLALDLWRVTEASGCGAVLDEQKLERVIHVDARRLAEQDGKSARDHALHDGEDFELIVALGTDTAAGLSDALGLLPIGDCIAGSGLTLRSRDGHETPLQPRGWEHFR